MADFYVGEIRLFAFDYAPIDWQYCNGTTVSVQQNQALFALLGTRYGGDGKNTFGLPNLISRSPIGYASSTPPSGLTAHPFAATGGQEQLPAHIHGININAPVNINATTNDANSAAPVAGAYLAKAKYIKGLNNDPVNDYYTGTTPPTVALAGGTTNVSGNTNAAGTGATTSILNPYLALNFCIALFGLWPQRP